MNIFLTSTDKTSCPKSLNYVNNKEQIGESIYLELGIG
jgi:hypothetical protein